MQLQTSNQIILRVRLPLHQGKTNLGLTPNVASLLYPAGWEQILPHVIHDTIINRVVSGLGICFQHLDQHLLDAFRLKEPEQNRLDQ
jgi:hypothetical protein